MTQWILTSCLLIVTILFIRAIGRDKLSARVRYALWALVLVRLLIPGSFGNTSLSVLNYVPEAEIVQERGYEPTPIKQQIQTSEKSDLPVASETIDTSEVSELSDTSQTTQTVVPTQPTDSTVRIATTPQSEPTRLPLNTQLILWVTGMILVGGVFAVSNLRFAMKLHRSRRYLWTDTLPVYETAVVETPCLFGFLQPAVYVTPDVLAEEAVLRHVLAHEQTHYRHKDHIWSLLRCVCLTLHWYNPLVWLAAYVSQQDAELACDEGAVKRIGEEERTAYARTLLELTCVGYKGILTTATSMTGSENTLKTRILRIVQNPQMPKTAIPIVLILALVVGLVVFTGEAADPMEGVWRAVKKSDRRPYPNYTRATIIQELEFRDGKARLMVSEDGAYSWARDYGSYTMEDGVLQLNMEDYEDFDLCEYELQGNTLKVYNANDSLEGEYVRYEKPTHAFLPQGIISVTQFVDVGGEPNMEVHARESVFWEHPFLYWMREGEILDQRKMPQELTWTEYCYRTELISEDGAQELYFTDGWVYFDGNGYLLSSADNLEALFAEMVWQPVGGLKDEFGLTYYKYQQPDVINVMLWLENGYRDVRRYIPEEQEQLTAALEEVRKHATTEKPESLADAPTLMDSGWNAMLTNVEGISLLNLYSDGTVSYGRFVDNEATGDSDFRTFYVLPEDAAEVNAVLKPYLDVYRATTIETDDDEYNGTWRLTGESPDSEIHYITLYFRNVDGSGAATTQNGTVAAQVGDIVYIKKFDFYVKDGILHMRWSDGTEESVPCRLEGDRLTITARDSQWQFEPAQWVDETLTTKADIIRLPGGYTRGQTVYVDLSQETLDELEALLREGSSEEIENIISTCDYYYKLTGLEEAFGSNEVTLSDYGTLHCSGVAYALDNREEVQAFLDNIFRTE